MTWIFRKNSKVPRMHKALNCRMKELTAESIGVNVKHADAVIDPSARFFKKIRLAEPYFRLISGSAEFLRKLRNSAENVPEHHKFGQQDRQIETIKFKI